MIASSSARYQPSQTSENLHRREIFGMYFIWAAFHPECSPHYGSENSPSKEITKIMNVRNTLYSVLRKLTAEKVWECIKMGKPCVNYPNLLIIREMTQ